MVDDLVRFASAMVGGVGRTAAAGIIQSSLRGAGFAALIPAGEDDGAPVEAAATGDAEEVAYVIMRLLNELKDLFNEWLTAPSPPGSTQGLPFEVTLSHPFRLVAGRTLNF